jgi:hypothetical protein
VPNTLRIDLRHTEEADPGLANRYFMGYTGTAPSDGDLVTYAGSIAAEWNTYLASLAVPEVALVEVVVTDLTSASSARGVWNGSHVGTRSGGVLPINACLLLNFKIGRRYRGGKPRIYAPWGSTTDLLTVETWTTSFLGVCNGGWSNFITNTSGVLAGGTSVAGQQNVSYYAGVEPPITLPSGRVKQASKVRPGPIAPDPITSFAANQLIGSQRRRVRT